MDLKPDEIELLKDKYLDHAEDLRFRTSFDFKLLSGFITLNIVIAAWLTRIPLATLSYKVAFAILIGAICAITILLFQRNFRRRKVVVEIMHNLNDALGFDKEGAFRSIGSINPKTNVKTTYWFPWYICTVAIFFLVQMFVIFGPVQKEVNPNTDRQELSETLYSREDEAMSEGTAVVIGALVGSLVSGGLVCFSILLMARLNMKYGIIQSIHKDIKNLYSDILKLCQRFRGNVVVELDGPKEPSHKNEKAIECRAVADLLANEEIVIAFGEFLNAYDTPGKPEDRTEKLQKAYKRLEELIKADVAYLKKLRR